MAWTSAPVFPALPTGIRSLLVHNILPILTVMLKPEDMHAIYLVMPTSYNYTASYLYTLAHHHKTSPPHFHPNPSSPGRG